MRFTRIELKNWKNFKSAQAELADRVFLIGPNASGKSNFLDVFRFLHDLVSEGGGLAEAVRLRGGIPKIRSLFARHDPSITVLVRLQEPGGTSWEYELMFDYESKSRPSAQVRSESVRKADPGEDWVTLLSRPDDSDRDDKDLLSQTALQQVTANKDFRIVAESFRQIHYMHLVPQLVREGQISPPATVGHDPLGRDLLLRMRATPKQSREARLRRIQEVLKLATPQLAELRLEEADEQGRPHLQVKFEHWRHGGSYQNESQLSDGTLRLIAILWSLQEKGGPLLLEEPEWSLHSAILSQFAPFIHRVQKKSGDRQILISTHSVELLSDLGIGAEEVLFLEPQKEGTRILQGAEVSDIRELMLHGIPASEAIIPRTRAKQIDMFGRTPV